MTLDNPHLPKAFKDQLVNVSKEQRDRLADQDPYGLTILQQFAMKIIRWYFYGQVGSGRTHLTVHLIIRRAIETKDSVMVFDHTLDHVGKERVIRQIAHVISACYPKYDYEIRLQTMSVRVWKRESTK